MFELQGPKRGGGNNYKVLPGMHFIDTDDVFAEFELTTSSSLNPLRMRAIESSLNMDLYQISFTVLVVSSGWLAWTQHKHELRPRPSKVAEAEAQISSEPHGDPIRFRRIFIPVYLLVMASDWLQGAYVYTLYKDEKGLAESTVAVLFTSGFLAAAVSALFVGKLADKYGRRLGCLVFCVAYALSCLTKIFDDVIILFIGRLLGGLSTTLMFSVFESWMVTEYFAQHLEKSSMSLSSMFSIMTTLNSIVAIISGILGESLVAVTGTKVSPFIAAVVCLGIAFWLIKQNWTENYGDSAALKNLDIAEKSTLKIILQDKRIFVLGFISCCFEGSIYIFVFYWSAAMESAHALSSSTLSSPSSETQVPYGVIFATFMAAMMLGSLLFSHSSSSETSVPLLSGPKSSNSSKFPFSLTSYLRLPASPSAVLTMSIIASSTSLLLPVLVKSEALTFWAFCVFEICVGIYFPSMGAQKGRIVDDGVRANIYGVLRIPLNIFVAVTLTSTVEGSEHRDKVFVFCGGLLLAAGLCAGWWLDDGEEEGSEPRSVEERVE